jgi:hypothetical protein
MKKSIFLLSALALVGFSSYAQTQPAVKHADKANSTLSTPAPKSNPQDAAAMNADLSMKFNETNHNFGNIPEGPTASFDFEFENIGKVPIILSNAHGSCGCTVPTWPKEPILPGKKNTIKVTYNTQGRPGAINKTVTVTSNVGTKVLTISGNVDKADTPATTTPANPTK